MPKAKEKCVGGHAVMAVGYDEKAKYVAGRNLSDDFWTLRTTENP
jgi:hypothetical protein